MEKITLASFDLDTSRLEASLDGLQSRYFQLKKEQEGYNNLSKETQKAINELTKSQLELAASGEEESQAFKDNAKAIADLNKVQEQNFKNSQNVANNMRAVKAELTQTEKQLRSYMNGLGQFETLQNQANAAIQTEIRNKNEARAANLALQKISNQLNPSIEEEAALLKEVNDQIDKNTKYIKENSSATAQQAMNVGNYTESIKDAFSELDIMNGGLTQFIQRSQAAGGAGNLIKGAFSSLTTGIVSATRAGLAFIATPIGAAIAALAAVISIVVGAFKLMTASMNSTEEGQAKLAKVTAIITGVLNSFFKILKPLGEFIGTVFIAAIEAAAEAIDFLVSAVRDGLDLLGFDDAAESVGNFQNAVKAGVKDAQDLAAAEFELARANREAQRTQLEYQKQAEKLRQARDDESKTIAERIEANKQLGVVLKEQLAAEMAIANQALKVAQLRIKAEGQSAENLDAQAEALTRISDIQERITGQESEQLANLNSLRKEAAEQEKQRREEAFRRYQEQSQKMIESMQLELDIYLQSQGIRKKSMEEELDIAKQTYEQELAIAKTQLQRKLITRREFELRELELRNEYAQKQVDLAVENADKELAAFISANQRKLVENQYFNDELYQQELDRLNRIKKAESKNALERFANETITYDELKAELAAIDQKYYEQQQAITKEREEAQKAKEAADLALRIEAEGEAFQYNLELQMERFNQEYEQEKQAAIAAGADMELFEKAQAAKRTEIERTVQANKVQLASNAFGQLASIAGESSAVGKALAVAQTTIDTYQSATSAYKALAGIPVVGPALGAVAAAAAVTSGLLNVKKILAVKLAAAPKRPSYATGVIGANMFGSGTSDSGTANISAGESILTARATQMFPQTLSAINQAGGGVGLDGSLSNAILQNDVQSRFDSDVNMEMIAEAVKMGAAMGTAKGAADGLIGLSDNRQVMADAKF